MEPLTAEVIGPEVEPGPGPDLEPSPKQRSSKTARVTTSLVVLQEKWAEKLVGELFNNVMPDDNNQFQNLKAELNKNNVRSKEIWDDVFEGVHLLKGLGPCALCGEDPKENKSKKRHSYLFRCNFKNLKPRWFTTPAVLPYYQQPSEEEIVGNEFFNFCTVNFLDKTGITYGDIPGHQLDEAQEAKTFTHYDVEFKTKKSAPFIKAWKDVIPDLVQYGPVLTSEDRNLSEQSFFTELKQKVQVRLI
jgi:hypothetical protein